MCSARYVTRISPPAPRVHRPSSGNGFLRRRRVLIELRPSDDARQKPIRAGSLPSRAVPTVTRTPHLATLLSDFRAGKFLQFQVSIDPALIPLLRSSLFDTRLTTLRFVRHNQFVPLRPATSCANRVTVRFVMRSRRERSRCSARPAISRRRHTKIVCRKSRICCTLLSGDDEPILQHGSPDDSQSSASRSVR